MSTYVFSISRLRRTAIKDPITKQVTGYKNSQLRLRERINKEGEVTAWATLHLDQLWLSGLHYAYVSPKGIAYSLNPKEAYEEAPTQKVSIEFLPEHLGGINWEEFLNPPTRDGVSLLSGVQLHVELKEGWQPLASLGLTRIHHYDVLKVSIVRRGEEDYINHPDEVIVDGDLFNEELYVLHPLKPQRVDTAEGIKALLQGALTKQEKVKSSRAKARSRHRKAEEDKTPKPKEADSSLPTSILMLDGEEENY